MPPPRHRRARSPDRRARSRSRPGRDGECNAVRRALPQRADSRMPLSEQAEVVSLIGDVALDGEHPKIHAHAVLGLRDGSTRGGHLLEAHVRPTLEVILTESPSYLKREFDRESGLALIRIGE